MDSDTARAFLLVMGALATTGGDRSHLDESLAEQAVQLTKVATLSGDEVRLLPSYAVVAQDSTGRFFATSRARDRILVFDKQGRSHSVIGRRGTAPGEFHKARHPITDSRGFVYVYDDSNRTLSVIDRDLKFKERLPMSEAPSLVLDDGRFIIAEQIRTPELVGFPLHLTDPRGRILKSFGTDTPQYRADLHLITDRIAAPARAGGVWAAPRGRYILDRWDPVSGRNIQRLAIQSSWFRESVRPISDERVRPAPLLQALWEDEQALWVLLRDADARWKPPAKAGVERPFDPQEYNATYDWILEAVDPRSGKIIASTRLETAHLVRSPSSLLVEHSSDGKEARFSVWRADLVKKEK